MTQSHRYGPSKRVSDARFLTALPPAFNSNSALRRGGWATRERLARWQAEAEALVRHCLPEPDRVAWNLQPSRSSATCAPPTEAPDVWRTGPSTGGRMELSRV